MGNRLPPFSSQELEAACRVLADTDRGLTGTQIESLLRDINIQDVDAINTKWKRLFNALVKAQNECHAGNHLILFINRAMSPISYARDHNTFQWRKDELNVVLSFSGYYVRDDGKVGKTDKATTVGEARARVGRLKAALEARAVHSELFIYCREELLQDNCFHAVFEATKGIAERIRVMSGLTADGGELITKAFLGQCPILAIGPLATESQRSEQKGLANLLIGLFGAVRNPLAHTPKAVWLMTEQDALDILTMVSLLHRKLDHVRRDV